MALVMMIMIMMMMTTTINCTVYRDACSSVLVIDNVDEDHVNVGENHQLDVRQLSFGNYVKIITIMLTLRR